MKLRKNTLFPIRFEYLEVLSDVGIPQSQLESVFGELERIRNSILDSMHRNDELAEYAFIGFPERSLHEYAQSRTRSELGRVFKRANRWHALADRVVLLGSGSACIGARAILDSCCQPYWNELDRAERGSKPRIYFEGDSFDNDSLQGLMHLLEVHKEKVAQDEFNRWALLVINTSTTTHANVTSDAAYFHLHQALTKSVANDQMLAELCATVSVNQHAHEIPSVVENSCFNVPQNLQGPFALFSPAGCLPAALVGVNVMELLAGATHMTQHFTTVAPNENLIFQLTALNHLLAQKNGTPGCTVRLWCKSLLSFGKWFEQFLAEFAVSHTVPKHPSQHRSSAEQTVTQIKSIEQRNRPTVNVFTDQWRFDTLTCNSSNTAPRSYTEALREELSSENRKCSSANLVLPKIDELHMGQLFQLFMLATLMESHLSR